MEPVTSVHAREITYLQKEAILPLEGNEK